ncbi:hypothetical protein SCMC78_69700 [Streptomyces sp. CMC78]|uniref:Uncharacterized protein n=1 Tax=Streptomyces sp. CMC78 TaxID=3231512 RepID=A0AB33KPT5_9ACTN
MLTQHTRGRLRTRTQRHGDRVTDTTRQRQQLQRGLTHRTVHMIDQNKNFSHDNALQTRRNEREKEGGRGA